MLDFRRRPSPGRPHGNTKQHQKAHGRRLDRGLRRYLSYIIR